MSGTRERIDAAIGSVLFNVSNFPEKAQARLLGQDMAPLRERITSAVLDALSTPPADDVREALAELTALEAKARAATPGPWVLDGIGKDEPEVNYWAHRFIGAVNGPDIIATSEDGHGPNAEYIAAASPDVVLALIKRLRAAEVRPRGTVTDAEVEAAARAMYEEHGEWAWSSLTDSFQSSYISDARAALEAAQEVRPRGTVTDGAHDRDHMMICRKCGAGLSALDVVDGEKPCPGPRGTVTDAEVQWEYGIRASGDAEPYSDVSEDVDWLTDGWVSGGEDHIVRRRKAGPWEVQT